MGLDVSHDCWHGAYSAFHRWRVEIGKAAGIALEDMEGYANLEPISWEPYKNDVISVLLNHSDCDGWIPAEYCGPLADRIEEILPKMPTGDGGGHIYDWTETTQRFIDGLRLAASQNEDVEFH